jgi:hypothetical protein
MSEAPRNLALMSVDPKTRKSKELARFALGEDGVVNPTWNDPYTKMDIMSDGIRLMGKKYRPKDGADFMKALPKAYSNSSFVYVKEL